MPGRFFGRKKYNNAKLTKPKIYNQQRCLNSKEIYPDEEEFFQVAIIDPGYTSCGLRIVRYNLESVSLEIIKFTVLNFGSDRASVVANMDSVFSDIAGYLSDCHHIMIEHQIMINQLGHQSFSWIIKYLTDNICNVGMLPTLIEVDVKLKTTFLGGPSSKRENGGVKIKEWSKDKSIEICKERGDKVSYHIIKNSYYKASEDLRDTVCYEYAWIGYVLSVDSIYIPFERKKLK